MARLAHRSVSAGRCARRGFAQGLQVLHHVAAVAAGAPIEHVHFMLAGAQRLRRLAEQTAEILAAIATVAL
jgi:hypothetical protein